MDLVNKNTRLLEIGLTSTGMTWGKLLVGKYKGAVPREPLPSHHLLSSTASMSLGFSVHLRVLWFEYRHGLEVFIQWPLFGGSVRRIELLDPRPRGRRELEENSGTPVTPWRVQSSREESDTWT